MSQRSERMKDGVAAALSAGKNSLPYLAIYEFAGAAAAPQAKDFEGLLLAHRIRCEPPTERLVTYWLSHDHWAAQDEKLRRFLAAAGTVVEGFAYDLVVRPEPLWRRLHLQTWVLALAALLGALDAIGNHYEWLFSRPFVNLTLKESLGSEPVAGRNFSATVLVSNQTRIEHRDLSFSAVLKPRDGEQQPTPLSALPEKASALSPGSATEVELTGEAPKAGRYVLQFTATGKAGILVGVGAFPLDQPVRVWPPAPSVQWTLKSQGSGYARIDAGLSMGVEAPHGVDCQIFLSPHRSEGRPILDYFDATNVRWIVDDNTPGAERESLSWHGPAPARHEKPFSCLIPATKSADLDSLKKSISVRCTKTEEG
jgi:hypothetical protein